METKFIRNDRLNESMYYKELESGLKVYFMPKEGYTKQYAIFSTDYGSIDSKFIPIGEKEYLEVPEGIAHFLEHKLFEEVEGDVFDKFSQLGADVNAYTNFTQTAYLFSSTENFYESLELLVKFVQNPHFTDENVEKEKGIIAQEINMYNDNPNWRVFFNCLDKMYEKNPVKIDIAGTVETIQKIDKELLYKCYNTFYNPNNMILFIVGDLDFDEIIKVVEASEKKDYPDVEVIERYYPEEGNQVVSQLVEQEMMTATPLFYIGFKDNDIKESGKDRVRQDFMTNIILEMILGSASTLYNQMYEESLVDNSFGAYYTGKKNYGHSLIAGQSKKPKEVYERILTEFETQGENILVEEDFHRIKKKNIGEFLMGLDSVEFIANSFSSLCFEDVMLMDYLDILESIEFKDVVDRFKSHLIRETTVLSIINPIKE